MSRGRPPKKQKDLSKDTINIEHDLPQCDTSSKLKVKNRVSIESENFVMCKVGKFDDHYTIVSKIGEGVFGTVYKVKHKSLHLERALKMIKKRGKKHFSAFEQIEVLKKLDHVNILKIFEFYEAPDCYYIITEIFQGRELFDLIVEQDKLTESNAASIMRQILRALNYCHSQKIAHRDLKPENILIKESEGKYKVKIIDWGLGTLMGNGKANRICGTPEYVAPEVLKGNYSIACDMWSIGAIAYVMLTGDMPFTGKNTEDTIQVVKKGNLKTNSAGFKALSQQAQQFIIRLMNKNQNKRMTAEQALNHPWIVKQAQEQKSPRFLKETLLRLRDFKVGTRFGTAVISYINNHLSEDEQRQKLEDIFKYLDKNGDGVLSLNELIQGYTNIYGKQMGRKIAEDTFNKLDINHNGSLQFSQFVTFGLQQEQQQQQTNLKQAFRLFDRDNNGKISKQQIKLVINGKEDLGIDSDFNDIIGQIDKNGDEQIDVDQFMKCISEYNQLKKSGKSAKGKSAVRRGRSAIKNIKQVESE